MTDTRMSPTPGRVSNGFRHPSWTPPAQISAARALTDVGGNLYIQYNDALDSFSFDNLTDVGDKLSIYNNAALPSFAIDSLTNIGGNLDIYQNDALTSFTLDNLMAVGGGLSIFNNVALCQSRVDTFVDTMTSLGWSGDTEIFDNADC